MASVLRQSKEVQDFHQKRLKALQLRPGNDVCADCKGRNPTWASTNLGVFICIRCCGLHRQLGVHISKVRSVTMDLWDKEQIDFMASIGNTRAAKMYEALVPTRYARPTDLDSTAIILQWIRDKYERRKFFKLLGDEEMSAAVAAAARNADPASELNQAQTKAKTGSGMPARGTAPALPGGGTRTNTRSSATTAVSPFTPVEPMTVKLISEIPVEHAKDPVDSILTWLSNTPENPIGPGATQPGSFPLPAMSAAAPAAAAAATGEQRQSAVAFKNKTGDNEKQVEANSTPMEEDDDDEEHGEREQGSLPDAKDNAVGNSDEGSRCKHRRRRQTQSPRAREGAPRGMDAIKTESMPPPLDPAQTESALPQAEDVLIMDGRALQQEDSRRQTHSNDDNSTSPSGVQSVATSTAQRMRDGAAGSMVPTPPKTPAADGRMSFRRSPLASTPRQDDAGTDAFCEQVSELAPDTAAAAPPPPSPPPPPRIAVTSHAANTTTTKTTKASAPKVTVLSVRPMDLRGFSGPMSQPAMVSSPRQEHGGRVERKSLFEKYFKREKQRTSPSPSPRVVVGRVNGIDPHYQRQPTTQQEPVPVSKTAPVASAAVHQAPPSAVIPDTTATAALAVAPQTGGSCVSGQPSSAAIARSSEKTQRRAFSPAPQPQSLIHTTLSRAADTSFTARPVYPKGSPHSSPLTDYLLNSGGEQANVNEDARRRRLENSPAPVRPQRRVLISPVVDFDRRSESSARLESGSFTLANPTTTDTPFPPSAAMHLHTTGCDGSGAAASAAAGALLRSPPKSVSPSAAAFARPSMTATTAAVTRPYLHHQDPYTTTTRSPPPTYQRQLYPDAAPRPHVSSYRESAFSLDSPHQAPADTRTTTTAAEFYRAPTLGEVYRNHSHYRSPNRHGIDSSPLRRESPYSQPELSSSASVFDSSVLTADQMTEVQRQLQAQLQELQRKLNGSRSY